jgi:large subunit ribosomal protein L1
MHSKKYQEIKKKIDSEAYSLDKAIDFIKENKAANFEEAVEIHIRLGINPKKTEQQVKGGLILPGGEVKKKKIAAFVSPENEKEAQEAGADLVGGKELIAKIKDEKKCDFDVAIAEPKIMKDLSQIAKILGPRGLMPNPKTNTVTTDIKKTIAELKKGKVNFRNDAGGNIHQAIAKVSWPKEKIKDNLEAFILAVKKEKPAGVKGNFIKGITLSSTMGPGLKIQN